MRKNKGTSRLCCRRCGVSFEGGEVSQEPPDVSVFCPVCRDREPLSESEIRAWNRSHPFCRSHVLGFLHALRSMRRIPSGGRMNRVRI